MLRLYDFHESGNGYKVRLLLSQLDIPYERVELDILKGETRRPEFLDKNPNGRIPVLELEDGTCLCESNAILWYLSEGTGFLPEPRLERARALQWMFFEQYSHEPYVAVVRFWHFAGLAADKQAEIPERMERGYQALAVMERHLKDRAFFVADRYSIADIALYAYTHVAEEGRFELSRFPAVTDWLGRVSAQPGHIPITKV